MRVSAGTVGLALLSALAGLVGILLFRAVAAGLRRKPLRTAPSDSLNALFQGRKHVIAARLAAALKLQTISYDKPPGFNTGKKAVCAGFHDHGGSGCAGPAKMPAAGAALHPGTADAEGALLQLHAYLQSTYPALHRVAERHVINRLSLVYVWRGSDPSLSATALYSHMDVVPVTDAEQWTHPPFAGVVADGYVWGRGAIDDKQAVIGTCEALEHLANDGFKPRRTIIVCLGHDEECGGSEGAAHIAYWIAHNMQPVAAVGGAAAPRKPIAFMLDEGLFVLDGLVPGVRERTALICTSEKGYVDVKLQTEVRRW
jgi:acetylornithine deacetylase/succinyl-diaminopimelate desuccinylase-like protein